MQVQTLKKDLMVVRRDLSARSAELEEAMKSNEELEDKLKSTGSAAANSSTQGGLMDMNGMVQTNST
eukprot:COSAG02_NODE_5475_length_4294_cov_2.033850_5_plen_67_part_00